MDAAQTLNYNNKNHVKRYKADKSGEKINKR